MTTFLFTTWEGAGNVPPEMAVAQRLVDRGHRVEVLGDPSTGDSVRAAGAGFRVWPTAPHRASAHPDDDPVRDWETTNPFEMMRNALEREIVGPAPAQAADVQTVVAEVAPDVVVCDSFQIGAQVGAMACGRPTASLIPNPYPFPVEGIPPFGVGWAPARGPAGRARDRLGRALLVRLWDKGLPDFNALRRSLDLPELASLWDHAATLDRQLVLTSAAFDLPGALPPNVTYVGPELADPVWAGSWEPPPGKDPLVLVAFSSGFMQQSGLIDRTIEALRQTGSRAVVTTGPQIDPAAHPAPDHVQVVQTAPHRQVLEQAAAVITHAGHGTTIKALAAGVPLVCLPVGRDQPDNTARVLRLGAGVRAKAGAKPERIARALAKVLDDPAYHEAARRFATQLADEHNPERAVHELETLAEARPAAATPNVFGVATGLSGTRRARQPIQNAG
jgi:MGT family glycosyltransferase